MVEMVFHVGGMGDGLDGIFSIDRICQREQPWRNWVLMPTPTIRTTQARPKVTWNKSCRHYSHG